MTALRERLGKILRLSFRLLLLLFVGYTIFYFYKSWQMKPSRIRYGVSFDPTYAEQLGLDWQQTYRALLDDLGTKKLRLTVRWNEVEPRIDQFDWERLDWMIAEADKRGVPVTLALGRKVPRWPECHDPEWLKNRPEVFASNRVLNLVQQAVTHFKEFDNIEAWQIENEPFFDFGKCPVIPYALVKNEVQTVRELDNRPVFTTDSGEGGLWLPSIRLGDGLGISMYRIVWFDFWQLLKPHYFKYPLPHWSYRLKAFLTGIPISQIQVVELQGEPWGSVDLTEMLPEEEAITIDPEKFEHIINYSKESGFKTFYWWGAEWWYYKKEHGEPYYWERVKKLLQTS